MKPALPDYNVIDERKRELNAIRNIARWYNANVAYRASVKALSLMTIGRGAFIRAIAHGR